MKKEYDKDKFSPKNADSKPDYRNKGRFERDSTPQPYWLYGKHPVLLAMKNPARVISEVVCSQNAHTFLEENLGAEKLAEFKIEVTTPDKIDRIIHAGIDTVHQGLAAKVEPLPELDIETLFGAKLIIATDKITDPHNIGAILRSAAAFGAGGMLMQEKNCPQESATIAKTSAGSLEVVPCVRVSSLWITLEKFKEEGFQIIGLAGDTEESITQVRKDIPTVLVVGSEGKGLSDAVIKICDKVVKINISENVESLNASVAAALALYEISRP